MSLTPARGQSPKAGEIGATRACPHCRTSILESAPVCPACKGHLRFGESAVRTPLESPFSVEGTLAPAPGEAPVEYSVVVAVRDERGAEVSRHVVGVGAVKAGQTRTFSVVVELYAETAKRR